MSSDDQASPVSDQRIIQDVLDTSQADQQKRQAVEEYSHKHSKGAQFSMRVKVYSPFRDYYDGRAFSVSAVNATGPFDILPKHHNFISLLSPCDLVVRTVEAGDDRRIRISGGIMHVKADKVVVFLDV